MKWNTGKSGSSRCGEEKDKIKQAWADRLTDITLYLSPKISKSILCSIFYIVINLSFCNCKLSIEIRWKALESHTLLVQWTENGTAMEGETKLAWTQWLKRKFYVFNLIFKQKKPCFVWVITSFFPSISSFQLVLLVQSISWFTNQ